MRYTRRLLHLRPLLTRKGDVNTGQVTHVTCDVSNVQSSNGFATCFRHACDILSTCFRLVCDPFTHVTQVCDQVFDQAFDQLDQWNLALTQPLWLSGLLLSDSPTTQQHRRQHSVGPVDHLETLSTGRHQQCGTSSVVLHTSTADCRSGVVVCCTVTLACPEAVQQDPEASWKIAARDASSRVSNEGMTCYLE